MYLVNSMSAVPVVDSVVEFEDDEDVDDELVCCPPIVVVAPVVSPSVPDVVVVDECSPVGVGACVDWAGELVSVSSSDFVGSPPV